MVSQEGIKLMNTLEMAEKGLMPDFLIRKEIRKRLNNILREIPLENSENFKIRKKKFISDLEQSPAALKQSRPNDQHYEIPEDFFRIFLGPYMKYSCCYWPENTRNLAAAEMNMLELVAFRGDIRNGHTILDLGCGWGAFSIWAAEKFPLSQVHALSNSSSQVSFINEMAHKYVLHNLHAKKADVSTFDTSKKYDRIVSVEMFEHMRNWKLLFRKISEWLKFDGKFFLHFFCHRNWPYLFGDSSPSDWMGYYFFTAGMMPGFDLPLFFQQDLYVKNSWEVNGKHYVKTLESWLKKMDANNNEIRMILQRIYNNDHRSWMGRWRIFLMTCSELFGMNNGSEWLVAHYLLQKKQKES